VTPKPDTSPTLRNIDRRLSAVEQILPTLATGDELREAISSAVAPLATRDEMRAAIRVEGEETRRHFDVVAESLRTDIRLIAEGHGNLSHRMNRLEHETARDIATLDRRVLRLEAKSAE
jgi:hypothetical protein